MTLKSLRRFGTVLLAAALSVQLCIPAFAVDRSGEEDPYAIFQKEEINPEGLRANDQVRIVVELEAAPLLASSQAVQAYGSVSDYLSSAQAQRQEASLSAQRSRVIRTLERSGMDLQVNREYSAVINGFSVTAAYGDLEAIQNTDGVKDAFVAELHPLVEPLDAEIQLADSVPMIGGDIMHNNGYTGKGTVVAILDTGLEIDHEAFQGQVNNPKYDQSDINDLIQNNSLTIGKLSAKAVYHSSKIPFAFDYRGSDTNVAGHYHGTHVAGIVGANSGDTVTGVAPDAQFFIMKVFDDEGTGAYDDDILAALDDSVKLGADSINMSLGSAAGFTTASTKAMNAVYQRVKEAGINLLCAAGNDYSATYNGASGNDLPYTTNPDYGIVGSPSTYESPLSVASVNNAQSTNPFFLVGTERIPYNDSAEEADAARFTALSGSFAYVDCGHGATTDFGGKDLKGKIALIQRGGEENGEVLTFQQKEANAVKAGASAAIIYDNVDGATINMATDYAIPCVFISRANGEKMLARTDKTLKASPDYVGQFSDAFSGQMSDFSSWGVTPDLKLKPEITAPGGNIYSTMLNNSYGSLSGTSMATPHLAGAAAVLDQYINEKLDGLNMTTQERSALVENLLMSTAVPVLDENGNPASPRKQGAGLIHLDRATAANACLVGQDGGRPKAETGASEDGQWSFSFQVKRLQGTASIPYEVSVSVLTEAIVTENGRSYIAQQSRPLTAEEYTLTAPAAVTLGQDPQTVNVSLSLTEKGKANLDRDFPNGIYVEGFVTLTPAGGDETVALSLPYMGFYGDWAKAPLFDATAYSGEEPNVVDMWLGVFDNRTGGGYGLGSPLYGNAYSFYDADKIAITSDTSQNVTAVCALLRSADSLTFSVTDSDGSTVYTETSKQASKSHYYNQSFYTPMAKKGFIPVDSWNTPLPDGQYTYTVTGQVAGGTQSISFPLTIDNEKPQVIRSEIVGSTWKVTVKDNHYVQAVAATVGNSPLTGWINPRETVPGAETTVEFDLSSAAFSGLTQAKIAIADYADNQFVSDWYSLSGATVIQPTSVTLDRQQLSLTEGSSTTLQATVLPENASNRTVTWSSSDAAVASVDASGTLTARKAGSAVITAAASNGLKASCQVTVTAAQQGKALASLSAPSRTESGSEVPFSFQMEQMTGVATVSFTFERDAGLSGGTVVGKNGFTSLGVQWTGNQGVMVLSYLGKGAGGTLTRAQLTELAELRLKAEAESGSLGVRLTGVSVCGYDENGNAVYLECGIKTAQAETAVGSAVSYDLNGDGVVDLLDITYCQMFYRATSTDSNWASAQRCDVDGSGTVDIQDLILILRNFT